MDFHVNLDLSLIFKEKEKVRIRLCLYLVVEFTVHSIDTYGYILIGILDLVVILVMEMDGEGDSIFNREEGCVAKGGISQLYYGVLDEELPW